MRVDYRREPCKTALTRVTRVPWDFSWSLNPYTGCAHRCTFCYVRGFERRAGRPFDGRYGASIRVKINVAEKLARELRRRTWKHENVLIGTATDPYQPAEGRYRLTRACIEALRRASTPFSIITRSPMIVRDIDVLGEAARRARVQVHVSIPTLDPDAWRTTEPETSPPLQRLRALSRLVDAGIDAGVSLAPILPGLSDRPEQLEAVVRAARAAGATHIWSAPLNLRDGTREHFLEQIAKDWPGELEHYLELYTRPYLPAAMARRLQDTVQDLARRYGIADRRVVPLEPPVSPQQLRLAI